MWNSCVVILDGPTAALGVAQTRQVLVLVVSVSASRARSSCNSSRAAGRRGCWTLAQHSWTGIHGGARAIRGCGRRVPSRA